MGLTGDGSDWIRDTPLQRHWEKAERRLFRGSVSNGKDVILIDNGRAVKPRIVLRKDEIELGCTKITPDVLRYLIAEYDAAFSPLTPAQKVLQP